LAKSYLNAQMNKEL